MKKIKIVSQADIVFYFDGIVANDVSYDIKRTAIELHDIVGCFISGHIFQEEIDQIQFTIFPNHQKISDWDQWATSIKMFAHHASVKIKAASHSVEFKTEYISA